MTYKELFTKLERRNTETGYDIIIVDEHKDFYDRVNFKQFNYVLSSDDLKDATLYGESFLNEVDENVGIEIANQLVLSLEDSQKEMEIDLDEEVIMGGRFVWIPNTEFYMIFLEEINIHVI